MAIIRLLLFALVFAAFVSTVVDCRPAAGNAPNRRVVCNSVPLDKEILQARCPLNPASEPSGVRYEVKWNYEGQNVAHKIYVYRTKNRPHSGLEGQNFTVEMSTGETKDSDDHLYSVQWFFDVSRPEFPNYESIKVNVWENY